MKRTFWIRANRQDLNATKSPTALDIAWAAGIFEGEGHVRLCGKKKRGLALAVSQKHPEILHRLRDWFGGSVSDPSGQNPCYHWNACGDNARLFLAVIFEYLSERRKSQSLATNCFEFLDGRSPVGMSSDELRISLLSYYEYKNENTWRGSDKSLVRRENYATKKAKRETAKVVAIA